MLEYDQIADWYCQTRDQGIGLEEVDALCDKLPAGATVADVGCGDGTPIGLKLQERGCRVIGVDSSGAMVARFRENLPMAEALHGTAQSVELERGRFDAVVAWGVLFHLTEPDQRRVIAKIAAWLKPGGHLLFTSGDQHGTRDGSMDGVRFRYWSLDRAGYAQALRDVGLQFKSHAVSCHGNSVYFASKSASVAD